MFKCPFCSRIFSYTSILDNHIVGHTKEKPHKCLICSKTFRFQSNLISHVKSVHNGIKQIRKRNTQCPLCSYKCLNKTELQVHSRKHSAELPFSCDIPSCGFKTKYKRSLSQHVRAIHSNERPFECPSDGCDYKAKTKRDLRSHLKIHSNEKPFACAVPGCNYTSKKKEYLKCHQSRVHSVKKPFKCSTCDYRAKSSSALKLHQLTHTNTKRFQCQAPNCGFASHQRENLKLHLERKHRKKDIRCTEPGCNYRCSGITLLKMHLKIHELPMLRCPGISCNYGTKYKSSLLRHISRFHEGVQSSILVVPEITDLDTPGTAGVLETLHCSFPDCGFQTKFPHHYDRHRKSHKEEEKRKHVCSFCFSRFIHLSTLKTHVQIHVAEKPYSCSYCEYTTLNGMELRRHASRAHHIRVIPRGKEDEVGKCRTCGRDCSSYSEFVLHSMNHLQPVVVLEHLKLHIL